MQTLLLMSLLALTGAIAQAQPQDDAAQAAQQASQQAMQASQQAMQAAQDANQQAMQAAQNTTTAPVTPFTAIPKFSVKQGAFSAPVTVKIKDASRGAIIYYTTDGWAPTVNSTRYKGPISIDSNTTIQAVAVAPYARRSFVASAQYTIKSPTSAPSLPVSPSTTVAPARTADGRILLPKATPVPLIFSSAVTSRTASVGDKISLVLADDLRVGAEIVARKGSPATATVIQADKSGAGGVPGEVDFAVNSLNISGVTITLVGSAAKEGRAKPPNAAVLIPGVNLFVIFQHGTEAEIKPGATFTASVAADAALTPMLN